MASDSDARQDDMQRAEHTALLKAVSSASDALFRARMMGVLGTPQMVADRGDALENARSSLQRWERANKWHFNLVEPENAAELTAEFARRVAAGS